MPPPYALAASPSATAALGARLLPGGNGTSFRVWAPYASAANVMLSTAGGGAPTSIALAPDAGNRAYWSADINGAQAADLYQFSIQNRGGDRYDPGGLPLLRTDPCAREVTSSDPKLPAVINDPSSFGFVSPFNTPFKISSYTRRMSAHLRVGTTEFLL